MIVPHKNVSTKVYQLVLNSESFVCHCGSKHFQGMNPKRQSTSSNGGDYRCVKCGFQYTAYPSPGTAKGG